MNNFIIGSRIFRRKRDVLKIPENSEQLRKQKKKKFEQVWSTSKSLTWLMSVET
jgi:hypothetical protein